MTISVIVPAAGCGARAALNGNKILAPLLEEKSVLFWTLSALCDVDYGAELLEIIVVARADEFEAISQVRAQLETSKPFFLVEGGTTRQDSVFEGIQKAQGDLVLVHDAARPCVAEKVIRPTVAKAQETGGAIAALPVSDTVKRADSAQNIAQTLNRSEIWLAQTPQVFRRDLLVGAFQRARNDGFQGTDCASIMEHARHDVALVKGDINNLKITYAADLERAAAILKAGIGGYYSLYPAQNPHQ